MTECGSLSKTSNCRSRQRFEKCFRTFLLFSLLIWWVAAAEATVAQNPFPCCTSRTVSLVWKWLCTLKNKFTVLQQFAFYWRRERWSPPAIWTNDKQFNFVTQFNHIQYASLCVSFVVVAVAAAATTSVVDWCETHIGHFPFSNSVPNEQIEKSSQTKRNRA